MALQTKIIEANGSKGHHKFTLTITENSTDITNNTSSVSFSFVLSPVVKDYDWSYSNTIPVTYSININGTAYSGNIMKYDGVSTVTITSNSLTVAHNQDGTKTISCSFSISDIDKSFLPGAVSKSDTMTLTAIPRAATITDAPNFNQNVNPTITYSNPAGNSVTSLQACISLTGGAADIAYRDISKTGTSYTFTLTEAEKQVLLNATLSGSNSRTVYFYVKTELGGNTSHSRLARTFTVINGAPVINPVAVDMNETTGALTGDTNIFIKGYSTAACNINAEAQLGASISAVEIVNGAQTANQAIASFSNVESGSFKFTATDNRGNTVSKTLTKTLIAYTKPTCNQKVEMALDGETGAVFNLTISGNYFNDTFGAVANELVLEVRHSDNDGNMGEWVVLTDGLIPTFKGNTYELTTTISGGAYNKAYTFQCRASDKLDSALTGEYTARLVPVFDWGENDFNFNVPVHCSKGMTEDIPVLSSGDCNELTASGDYYIGVNGANRPVAVNGWLTVKAYGTNTIYQKFITYQGSEYARSRINGTWGAWSLRYGSGTWTPTLVSGADSLTGFSSCTYHKTGNIVTVSVLCWGTFTNRNSSGICISLPFKVGSMRSYGQFGYSNINNTTCAHQYVYAGQGNTFCELKYRGSSGQEVSLTGTGLGKDSWTFQFSLTYGTDE